jgi:NAD(P)-dependent dehydrogenase (short-subunit alcohol dehydrogenase family)
MSSNGRLSGKVAVITGATSGLGRAGALRFAKEGAKVVAASRREQEGKDVVKEIKECGGEALFVSCDVREPREVERLVGEAESQFGKVDVLYASAGVMMPGTAPETTEEEFRQTFDVNVAGTFWLAKYGIPALARNGGGSLILTASELGLVGTSRAAAYCASKGAVVNLTRALAVDCRGQGIRVNCICPGPIDTPMLRDQFARDPDPAAAEKAQTDPVLLKRVGRPQEIADVALHLASDESSYMTGSIVVVDGGATSWYGL